MLEHVLRSYLPHSNKTYILHSAGHVLELVLIAERNLGTSTVCKVYALRKLLYTDCEYCRKTLASIIALAYQMGLSVQYTDEIPVELSPGRISEKHFMEFLLQYEKFYKVKKILEDARKKFESIVEEIIAECVRGGVVRVLDESFRAKIERAICLTVGSQSSLVRELLRSLYTSTFVDKVLKRRRLLVKYCMCKHVIELLSLSSLADVTRIEVLLSESARCAEELRAFCSGKT